MSIIINFQNFTLQNTKYKIQNNRFSNVVVSYEIIL